jgi:FkbH-like protein
VTSDDLAKTAQYRSNAQRQALQDEVTDLDSYLRALDMVLDHAPFNAIELPRITQLINKTNQFNLTTRRYSEPAVAKMMNDPLVVGRRFRLTDRFGDNGLISVIIGFLDGEELVIDTWLMSCRVLGRGVEQAALNVIVEAARAVGVSRIVGDYVPSDRNGMVKSLYADLGFTASSGIGEASRWSLEIAGYKSFETRIEIRG